MGRFGCKATAIDSLAGMQCSVVAARGILPCLLGVNGVAEGVETLAEGMDEV